MAKVLLLPSVGEYEVCLPQPIHEKDAFVVVLPDDFLAEQGYFKGDRAVVVLSEKPAQWELAAVRYGGKHYVGNVFSPGSGGCILCDRPYGKQAMFFPGGQHEIIGRVCLVCPACEHAACAVIPPVVSHQTMTYVIPANFTGN